MITVEATVIDKSGNPITDLTAADFQIVEDGVSHPVQTIYLVSPDPAFVRANTVASTTGNTGVATAAPVRRELRSRVMIFVFDLAHLSTDAYKRSRAAVESYLKDPSATADLIGVVAGSVMLNNKIDTDKAALLKAMETMKGPNQARYNDLRAWPRLIDEAEAAAVARGDRETTTRVVQRGCGERPEECQQLGGDEPVRQQVEAKARQINAEAQRDAQLSLATMQTLANGLARFPGSKHVLVFTDGFFTGDTSERMRAVVQLAARNNVRFSTFDARGLSRDPRTQSFMNDQPLQAAGDLSSLLGDNDADVLSSLAIDTGGEVIMNRNDLRPGIDIVAKQAGTYYMLGYAPTRQMDGEYHSISVQVTRPNVTIRARKGYVATKSATEAAAPAPVAPAAAPPAAPAAPLTSPTPPAVTPPTAVAPPAAGAALALVDPPVAPAAPRFRPNSDRNVAALTKVTPGSTSADVKTLADQGWDAYALGDVAVAREKLSAAVATGKAAPWVSYALGFSEYALGRYEAAGAAWESVRAAVPEFMPVYFDIADAHLSLGRSSDALAILRDAARRWPLEPEPQNALGTMLVKRGAYDEAIDVFARITTSKPADSLGFFNIGRAYHLRYLRLQQNVASANLPSKSAIGEDDRQKAIAAYRHYLTLGGPFEKEAREALTMLDWRSPGPIFTV